MLRLLVTHGHEELTYAVPEGAAKLGSAGENDIVLAIPGISRRHARVKRLSAGAVEVSDLQSTNGLLIAGQKVERAVLTPGLRIQVGAAWLEVEEVSTSEEALARLTEHPPAPSLRQGQKTESVGPEEAPRDLSPEREALDLAYHIAQAGVGVPEQRADLLHRINAVLQAEAFATLDRTRFDNSRIWESVGTFSTKEKKLLTALAGGMKLKDCEEIVLKRSGKTLIAGRDSWWLAARFSEESLAREGWRKEFLRFLMSRFFPTIRNLDEIDKTEAIRVRGLMRGNKVRTADLLGICRNTLDKLLGEASSPKPSKR